MFSAIYHLLASMWHPNIIFIKIQKIVKLNGVSLAFKFQFLKIFNFVLYVLTLNTFFFTQESRIDTKKLFLRLSIFLASSKQFLSKIVKPSVTISLCYIVYCIKIQYISRNLCREKKSSITRPVRSKSDNLCGA